MPHLLVSRRVQSAALMILCVALSSLACSAQSSSPSRQPVVNASLDLVDEIDQIEGIYNIPIYYEDRPHVHSSEKRADARGHLVGKSGEKFNLTFEKPAQDASFDQRKLMAAEALNRLVEDYDQQKGSRGWFVIVPNEKGFDVKPAKYVDRDGQTTAFNAVLDAQIKVPRGDRGLGAFMVEVAKSLNDATGYKIAVGTLPEPLFRQYKTTISSDGEEARSLLRRFFDSVPVAYIPEKKGPDIPTTMSWKLKCIPPEGGFDCMINVEIVTPTGRPAVGKGPALPPVED